MTKSFVEYLKSQPMVFEVFGHYQHLQPVGHSAALIGSLHLVSGQKKIDVKPIFTVPDIMPNLALISGTVKISVASILLCLNISWCYCTLLVNIISDRPCNFEGKTSTKPFF